MLCVLVWIFFSILKELSPVITCLFVLLATIYSLSRWTTAGLAITGLLIYMVAWHVDSGVWLAYFGILSWFSAIFISFWISFLRPQPVPAI